MSLIIRDKNGKFRGMWVARTSRGFNKKQKKEIREVRLAIALESGFHLSGIRHCEKCLTPEMFS